MIRPHLVYQFIVAHDLHRLTLVRHPFGGGVALITSLYLAETSPARQRRLILIDSIAYKQRLPGFLRYSPRRSWARSSSHGYRKRPWCAL